MASVTDKGRTPKLVSEMAFVGRSEPYPMAERRLADLQRFYSILDRLGDQVGGVRRLRDCDGRMEWPGRGVYFFFEDGEGRTDSGKGMRVVRVGTHALIGRSRTTLWHRLSQHRGVRRSGGGNHRGSVFRQHVGTALSSKDPDVRCSSWAQGSSASAAIRQTEHSLESIVTRTIGAMPFLWLGIGDPPGPESDRGYIERHSIALLSNLSRLSLDSPSPCWLGQYCRSKRVRESGLWNSVHVDAEYDSQFLDCLENLVEMAA